MSRKVSGGFRTVWTGEEYIPGSSSGPKGTEYRPTSTSILTCTQIKARCSSDVDPFKDKLRVVRYPASMSPNFVSVYSQYPLRREWHTELTSVRFGWLTSNSWNRPIFRSQLTWNKPGFSLIVHNTLWLSNSFSGTLGTGEAVSPQRAVSLKSSWLDKLWTPHRNLRV